MPRRFTIAHLPESMCEGARPPRNPLPARVSGRGDMAQITLRWGSRCTAGPV